MLKTIQMIFVGLLMIENIACSSEGVARRTLGSSDDSDPYLWLEPYKNPPQEVTSWVKSHNEKSLSLLQNDPRYSAMEKEVRAILLAKDRLPAPGYANGYVYNFWQDEKSVRGVWRRMSYDKYVKHAEDWDMIIDVDALEKQEKQNWVWKGAVCLPPANERCLVSLSRGGKDSVEVREFDIKQRQFVKDGFFIPDAKSSFTWMDLNTLIIGTDFGQGSLTSSGYPRIAKLWKRGTTLSEAKTVFEGQTQDVSVDGFTSFRPEGNVSIVSRSMTFYTSKQNLLLPDGSLKPVPLPEDAAFWGLFKGQILALLRSDWKVGETNYSSGSLISIPLSSVVNQTAFTPEVVYAPDSKGAILEGQGTEDRFYLSMLQNVQGKIFEISRESEKWISKPVSLPEQGTVTLVSSDPFDHLVMAQYESFLKPTTLYTIRESGKLPEVIWQLPKRFNDIGLVSEQFESTSKDGTKIPYFIIHKKGIALDGSHPTLLYGYGGFEDARTPFYLNAKGKIWSEKGGIWVLANIRGGGEFGPKWHEAAIGIHHQRVFDDFISVAEDLIQRGFTSPKRLAIQGGSNGGLLVGGTFTQRPDLFNGVLCEVPLLDMLRYTQLGAGSSWIAEYGDPADPQMRAVIAKYSPYQNVQKSVKYPSVFFVTASTDDRVTPSHARKMTAKMEEYGNAVLFFENQNGGHGASADLEELIQRTTLEYTYLVQRLMD